MTPENKHIFANELDWGKKAETSTWYGLAFTMLFTVVILTVTKTLKMCMFENKPPNTSQINYDSYFHVKYNIYFFFLSWS